MNAKETVTIYVYLPDEAVDVWRPVEAEPVGQGRFRIVSRNVDPESEKWQFNSGDVVLCKNRALHEGATNRCGLVAVSRADEAV